MKTFIINFMPPEDNTFQSHIRKILSFNLSFSITYLQDVINLCRIGSYISVFLSLLRKF